MAVVRSGHCQRCHRTRTLDDDGTCQRCREADPVHNTTCRWCKRAWTKTLSGNVVCPHCTKPRTSLGSEGAWWIAFAFLIGVGVGTYVTFLILEPKLSAPSPAVELPE